LNVGPTSSAASTNGVIQSHPNKDRVYSRSFAAKFAFPRSGYRIVEALSLGILMQPPTLRNLEPEEQEFQVKLAALRSAIDAGDSSGIARGDVFQHVRKTLKLRRPRR
jgi:hypothetical protein